MREDQSIFFLSKNEFLIQTSSSLLDSRSSLLFNVKMNRILPIYLSTILLLSLLQLNVLPVQSIALSNLCGQFGHSCFGGKIKR